MKVSLFTFLLFGSVKLFSRTFLFEGNQQQSSRGTSVKSSNGRSSTNKVQEERTMAAKHILQSMRKQQETFVSANEDLALCLIKLAYQKDPKITSGRVAVSNFHDYKLIEFKKGK